MPTMQKKMRQIVIHFLKNMIYNEQMWGSHQIYDVDAKVNTIN